MERPESTSFEFRSHTVSPNPHRAGASTASTRPSRAVNRHVGPPTNGARVPYVDLGMRESFASLSDER